MYVLKMTWDGVDLYLTKDDRVTAAEQGSHKIRVFHTRESAEQYMRYAFGAKCDLYVSHVGQEVPDAGTD
jgi:hypothetical protein